MKRRSFLVWFSAGHLANDWPITSLWLIVPSAGLSMGLSPAEVGLLFTLTNLGGALANIPAGILCDHVSNRGRLLLATFWWCGVGYLAASFAPDYLALAALLALAGLGNAAWHPMAAGVLTRESGERRAEALGAHAVGGSLAEVLAPLCAGVLLAYVDWRAALMISAAPAVLMGVFFIGAARAVPRIEKRPFELRTLFEFVKVWRRREGRRLIAMICLYNMGLLALFSMIPFYLADEKGLSPTMAGVVFAGLVLIGPLAQPLVGKISDRRGRRPITIFGCLTAAAAGVVLVLEPPFWLMLVALLFAVASLNAIRACVLATAVDYSERGHSLTLGLAFMLMDGVGALGAVLAGLAAGFSWSHMFGFAALCSLGAAVLAMAPPRRRSTSADLSKTAR